MTTAHAHKSGVIFHIFSRAFKKKITVLRPKMTEIASRGVTIGLEVGLLPKITFWFKVPFETDLLVKTV